MSENESKFTNEYILKAFNCAVFLDEPACTEMREALNEMMGLKQRIATLEASLRWIPVSEKPTKDDLYEVELDYIEDDEDYAMANFINGHWFYRGELADLDVLKYRPIPELPTPEVSE